MFFLCDCRLTEYREINLVRGQLIGVRHWGISLKCAHPPAFAALHTPEGERWDEGGSCRWHRCRAVPVNDLDAWNDWHIVKEGQGKEEESESLLCSVNNVGACIIMKWCRRR